MQIKSQYQNYPHSSIRRFQALQKQEEQISKAFKIQNFYQDNKFDISQLKQKIQQFKHKKLDSIYISQGQKLNTIKQRNNMSVQYQSLKHKTLQKRDIRTNQNNRQNNLKYMNQQQSKRQKYVKSNIDQYGKLALLNPQIKNKTNNQRINQKQSIKTSHIKNRLQNFKIHPIKSSKNKKTESKLQKSYEFSQSSTIGNFYQKKIIVNTPQKLMKFQIMVQQLWNLYQLLTKIMCGILVFPFEEQKCIQKYVQAVCSNKFEYIKDIMLECLNKRFHKAIITSKLLQNVSIVYLILQLYKKKKIKESHITNFIGYCTSNIIFLIKIIYLIHEVKGNSSTSQTHQGTQQNKNFLNFNNNLYLSQQTQRIMNVIKQFEINSYKQNLNSLTDIILRMEHNNEVINIVQTRLCQKSDRQVQNILKDFLKVVIFQKNKPFYQYSHYIFQFLAYYIASLKIYGVVKAVQIAPQPYLNLKYLHTVVIQPYGVLVFQKNKNIYIRAHSQTFIDILSNYCNVIFWSDMMPTQIDPILQLFPKKQNISYLYKYHCRQQNGRFIKPIDRIGCRLDNTIIIDRQVQNYQDNKQNGIELGWKGQKKDVKLAGLIQLLEPLFSQDKSLRRSLYSVRAQILLLSKKKQMSNNLRRQKFISPSQDEPSIYQNQKNQYLPSFDPQKTTFYNHENYPRKYEEQKQENQNFQLPMMVTKNKLYLENNN